MSERQKTFFALLASCLFHVVIAMVCAFWLWLHPPRPAADLLPELKQLEVTLMAAAPTPTPAPAPPDIAAVSEPTPPAKVVRQVIDTEGLQASETPPENAPFESNINSRAASEAPASANGDPNLPSQAGFDLKSPHFTAHDSSMGEGQRQSAAAMEVAKAAPSAPAQPTPLPTPAAKTGEQVTANPTPLPTPFFQPTPVPEPTPAPSPTPENSLALGKPTPVPVNTPAPQTSEQAKSTPAPAATPKPTATPSFQQLAKLTAPQSLPSEAGTQEFKEKTKIEGGVRNRGKTGVDAIASPMGRYSAVMHDIIGARWSAYIKQRADLVTATGEVAVTFKINTDGTIDAKSLRVLSNTASDGLATITKNAILNSKLPPVPDDLAPYMDNGQLEIRSLRFNCYDFNQQ